MHVISISQLPLSVTHESTSSFCPQLAIFSHSPSLGCIIFIQSHFYNCSRKCSSSVSKRFVLHFPSFQLRLRAHRYTGATATFFQVSCTHRWSAADYSVAPFLSIVSFLKWATANVLLPFVQLAMRKPRENFCVLICKVVHPTVRRNHSWYENTVVCSHDELMWRQ